MVNRFVYTQTKIQSHTHAGTHARKILYPRCGRVWVGLWCCMLFPSNFPPLKFEMLYNSCQSVDVQLGWCWPDSVGLRIIYGIWSVCIKVYTVTNHRWYKAYVISRNEYHSVAMAFYCNSTPLKVRINNCDFHADVKCLDAVTVPSSTYTYTDMHSSIYFFNPFWYVRTVDGETEHLLVSDRKAWCVHPVPDDFYFARFIWVFILLLMQHSWISGYRSDV